MTSTRSVKKLCHNKSDNRTHVFYFILFRERRRRLTVLSRETMGYCNVIKSVPRGPGSVMMDSEEAIIIPQMSPRSNLVFFATTNHFRDIQRSPTVRALNEILGTRAESAASCSDSDYASSHPMTPSDTDDNDKR